MTKRRLLVVDDDVALVEMLKDHFEFEGYEVFKAFDGAEGIEAALVAKPDLILLDIRMPKMGGLEACRRLKEHADTMAVPILMLSADAQQKTIQQILAAGAAACATKPFSIETLSKTVRDLLPRPPAAAT